MSYEKKKFSHFSKIATIFSLLNSMKRNLWKNFLAHPSAHGDLLHAPKHLVVLQNLYAHFPLCANFPLLKVSTSMIWFVLPWNGMTTEILMQLLLSSLLFKFETKDDWLLTLFQKKKNLHENWNFWPPSGGSCCSSIHNTSTSLKQKRH